MKGSVVTIWLIALLAAVGVTVFPASRAYSAWTDARFATKEFDRLASQSRELVRLKANVPSWISRERQENALAPTVSAVLAQAGLPASAMQSLSGEAASSAISGNASQQIPAKRKRAVLTLTGLTLPQLGKFLAAWRNTAPAWTATSLEIAPENAAGRAGTHDLTAVGGDQPLRIVMAMETVFLDQQPPQRAEQGSRR